MRSRPGWAMLEGMTSHERVPEDAGARITGNGPDTPPNQVNALVDIENLVKTFGHTRALDGFESAGPRRRGARVPGAERVGQVDHDPGAVGIVARRLRVRAAAGRRSMARSSHAASPTGLRARRCEPVVEPDRRRNHRSAGAAARHARPESPSRADRDLRARPDQEGAGLFEGEPAEGGPGGGAGIGCRAAAARRADLRPGPDHGEQIPGLHRGVPPQRRHGAAVESHPRRGGESVRPGQHPAGGSRGRDRVRWPICAT